MDDKYILQEFKKGCTIMKIVSDIYYQRLSEESTKAKKERSKVNKKEIQTRVEKVILDDYLNFLGRAS